MTASQDGYLVDTSIAIKWLIDEDGSDKAMTLRDADLVAPTLFRIEAGNLLRTLATKQAISAVRPANSSNFSRPRRSPSWTMKMIMSDVLWRSQ